MSASAPPPPYNIGAAPVAVEMQPVTVTPVYIGQGVQPTPVVVVTVKRVHQATPYLEFCPRCQTSVMTRTEHVVGACWWIICFIGFFVILWPILFCLCCNASKDTKHYCPNCASYLAIRKRAC